MGVSLSQLEQAALPPESKLILESLRRAVEHLRGLTRGLQSLSADPEVKDASPATTRLHTWWAEAISPYKWSLAPGVKLHASGVDSTSLPPVAIPRHVLMQAVFNLVQNASDALIAGGGGNVWLSAVLAEDGKAVLLAVRDDGPGMDPETVGRCTEPFYTTKSRGRGTGLGLSLVRTAMERHRGRLLIESSPDHGSTFTIVLPVVEPVDVPHGARQATLTVGDLRVRAMITALLSNARVEVLSPQVLGGDNVGVKGTGATPRGFLWVVDGSVDPLDVLRFLDEAGPNVRVVALGKSVSTSPGSAGEAATQDGRLVQITDEPSHTTLQAALRRAVIGWAP